MERFFNGLKNQLILDYKDNKLILCLEFLGTVSSISAACSLAYFGKNIDLFFVLAAYLLGSIFWGVASVYRRNSFNFLLCFCYSVINILGIIRCL